MATRVTFIIRDDEMGQDPSTILDTATQMLSEQLDRYCLTDDSGETGLPAFDENDVMVQAHPEGAPVDHIDGAIDAASRKAAAVLDTPAGRAFLKRYTPAALRLAKSARELVAEERIKDRTPPHHYSEAHRAILQLATTIDGEG